MHKKKEIFILTCGTVISNKTILERCKYFDSMPQIWCWLAAFRAHFLLLIWLSISAGYWLRLKFCFFLSLYYRPTGILLFWEYWALMCTPPSVTEEDWTYQRWRMAQVAINTLEDRQKDLLFQRMGCSGLFVLLSVKYTRYWMFHFKYELRQYFRIKKYQWY